MKYKDCCDDLSNIEIQIKELQLQKKEYETAKKNVIENLTHEYSDNISKIDSILTELEKKENYFNTEIKDRGNDGKPHPKERNYQK